MKIKILVTLALLAIQVACVGPRVSDYTAALDDSNVVFESDLQPATDSRTVEYYWISAINGKRLGDYEDKRVGKDAKGYVTKFYFLFPPGQYDVTYGYFKSHVGVVGDDSWSAEVTKKVELKNGLYKVKGTATEQFATIWIDDSYGKKWTSVEEALIKKTPKPMYVPIIIPR